MSLVTFNIPEDTKNQLDKYQGNKSGLISKLLAEYFQKHNDIIEDQQLENVEGEIRNYRKKLTELLDRKEIIMEERKDKEDEKDELIETYIESLLRYCEVDEEQAKQLANEYYDLRHKMTMTKFVDEKGVTMKE